MDLPWYGGCTLALVTQFVGRRMRKGRITVLYRENCGGVLRNLASGLRRTARTLADLDLYDDLRERIFRQDASMVVEPKKESAA